MTSERPTVSVLGTGALLFESPGHEMTLATQQRIWSLSREAAQWPEVREAVPGMNNLMLSLLRAPRSLDALSVRLLAAWEIGRASCRERVYVLV